MLFSKTVELILLFFSSVCLSVCLFGCHVWRYSRQFAKHVFYHWHTFPALMLYSPDMMKWEFTFGLWIHLLWFFAFCLLVPDWSRGGNGSTFTNVSWYSWTSNPFKNLILPPFDMSVVWFWCWGLNPGLCAYSYILYHWSSPPPSL